MPPSNSDNSTMASTVETSVKKLDVRMMKKEATTKGEIRDSNEYIKLNSNFSQELHGAVSIIAALEKEKGQLEKDNEYLRMKDSENVKNVESIVKEDEGGLLGENAALKNENEALKKSNALMSYNLEYAITKNKENFEKVETITRECESLGKEKTSLAKNRDWYRATLQGIFAKDDEEVKQEIATPTGAPGESEIGTYKVEDGADVQCRKRKADGERLLGRFSQKSISRKTAVRVKKNFLKIKFAKAPRQTI